MSSDTVHIAWPQRRCTLVSAPHLFLLWKTCGQSGSLLSELSVKSRESSPSSQLMQLNNIIPQSLASANISKRLEPSGEQTGSIKMVSLTFHCQMGNSLRGMRHAWIHSAAPTEVHQLSREQEEPQPLLRERRQDSTSTRQVDSFQPIAVETYGSIVSDSLCFPRDLGQIKVQINR